MKPNLNKVEIKLQQISQNQPARKKYHVSVYIYIERESLNIC